jgi:hypothetical protein
MGQVTELRALARWRAAVLKTAAETMAGKFDRPTVPAPSHAGGTDGTVAPVEHGPRAQDDALVAGGKSHDEPRHNC